MHGQASAIQDGKDNTGENVEGVVGQVKFFILL
jgi:hypothetical protein